ncbi:unnamed protein product [Leuciscus chuanchicus]
MNLLWKIHHNFTLKFRTQPQLASDYRDDHKHANKFTDVPHPLPGGNPGESLRPHPLPGGNPGESLRPHPPPGGNPGESLRPHPPPGGNPGESLRPHPPPGGNPGESLRPHPPPGGKFRSLERPICIVKPMCASDVPGGNPGESLRPYPLPGGNPGESLRPHPLYGGNSGESLRPHPLYGRNPGVTLKPHPLYGRNPGVTLKLHPPPGRKPGERMIPYPLPGIKPGQRLIPHPPPKRPTVVCPASSNPQPFPCQRLGSCLSAARRFLGCVWNMRGIFMSLSADRIQKATDTLQNKLDWALIRCNERLTKNSQLREEVKTLHVERARFQKLHRRWEKVLQDVRKEIGEVIDMATTAFDEREEAQTEITMMKEDFAEYSAEMKELKKAISHEHQLNEFMTTKNKERTAMDDGQEKRRRQGH